MGFYESLLVHDSCSYLESRAQRDARSALLGDICASQRLRSPFSYDFSWDYSFGFGDDIAIWYTESKKMMALVFAECAHNIAEALHQRWNQSRFQNGLEVWIDFQEDEGEKEEKRERKAIFDEYDISISKTFSPLNRIKFELLRPGTVIELSPTVHGRVKGEQILLGTFESKVWTSGKKPEFLHTKRSIRLYATKDDLPPSGWYRMHPLVSLLSYERQVKALRSMPIRLYPDLMFNTGNPTGGPVEAILAPPEPQATEVTVASGSDGDTLDEKPTSIPNTKKEKSAEKASTCSATNTGPGMMTRARARAQVACMAHRMLAGVTTRARARIAVKERNDNGNAMTNGEKPSECSSNVSSCVVDRSNIGADNMVLSVSKNPVASTNTTTTKISVQEIAEQVEAPNSCHRAASVLASKNKGDNSKGTEKVEIKSASAAVRTSKLGPKMNGARTFTIPPMNAYQAKASQEFLNSGKGSITIVQGPPGMFAGDLFIRGSSRLFLKTSAH